MQKLFLGLILLMATADLHAQKDSIIAPPYKRFPTVPPFKLLKPDSVSVFTKADLKKNKAVLVMIFSPECDHCQHETEEIVKRIDDFKNIQIVMATTWPLQMMNSFVTKYGLAQFKNITIGQDTEFMLPSYYNIGNMPFLAFYDKKGNLIDVFEGNLPVEKVLAKFE
ncbi:MAG: redoxin domain-containing protein [Bacteroidota bacterium]